MNTCGKISSDTARTTDDNHIITTEGNKVCRNAVSCSVTKRKSGVPVTEIGLKKRNWNGKSQDSRTKFYTRIEMISYDRSNTLLQQRKKERKVTQTSETEWIETTLGPTTEIRNNMITNIQEVYNKTKEHMPALSFT